MRSGRVNTSKPSFRATATRVIPQASAVRSFNSGDLVYPTGEKNGVWWEVNDETGNAGWVFSPALTAR